MPLKMFPSCTVLQEARRQRRQQLQESRAERDQLVNRLDEAHAQIPPSQY